MSPLSSSACNAHGNSNSSSSASRRLLLDAAMRSGRSVSPSSSILQQSTMTDFEPHRRRQILRDIMPLRGNSSRDNTNMQSYQHDIAGSSPLSSLASASARRHQLVNLLDEALNISGFDDEF